MTIITKPFTAMSYFFSIAMSEVPGLSLNELTKYVFTKYHSFLPSYSSFILYGVPECLPSQVCDGLFLCTNEKEQEETLEILKRFPITGNTVIGVSGLFILNAVAARGVLADSARTIDNIVIIDCNPRVQAFWNRFIKILSIKNVDRESVIERLKQTVTDECCDYWPTNAKERSVVELKNLQLEIGNKISFLSDDFKFRRIKQIAENGNVVFKMVDCFDSVYLRSISGVYHAHQDYIDTLYLSNVSEFSSSDRAPFDDSLRTADSFSSREFIKSVESAVDRQTLIIHSYKDAILKVHQLVFQQDSVHPALFEDVFSFHHNNTFYFSSDRF